MSTKNLIGRLTACAILSVGLAAGTMELLGLDAESIEASAEAAVVSEAVTAHEPIELQRASQVEDAFLTELLGEGTDYTEDQRTVLVGAALRVCDGITAEVPLVHMAGHLSETIGLTDTEARDFVYVAGITICATPQV